MPAAAAVVRHDELTRFVGLAAELAQAGALAVEHARPAATDRAVTPAHAAHAAAAIDLDVAPPAAEAQHQAVLAAVELAVTAAVALQIAARIAGRRARRIGAGRRAAAGAVALADARTGLALRRALGAIGWRDGGVTAEASQHERGERRPREVGGEGVGGTAVGACAHGDGGWGQWFIASHGSARSLSLPGHSPPPQAPRPSAAVS